MTSPIGVGEGWANSGNHHHHSTLQSTNTPQPAYTSFDLIVQGIKGKENVFRRQREKWYNLNLSSARKLTLRQNVQILFQTLHTDLLKKTHASCTNGHTQSLVQMYNLTAKNWKSH